MRHLVANRAGRRLVVALICVLAMPALGLAQAPPSGPPAAAAPPPATTTPPQAETPASAAPASSPATQTAPAAVPPSSPAPRADSLPVLPSDVLTPAADARLPHDLSPWGMFLAADIVVKAVMVGLAFASVLTWTIWFAKAMELLLARRRIKQALAGAEGSVSLADCAERCDALDASAAELIDAAEAELRLSSDSGDVNGVKERVASRFERIQAAVARRMARGTGLLATIGATAPFVGLFGTVWGIMNAFIGISKSHTTNLAVVAPGIAEALLATALGLVAAIPAVVLYNMFARWIAGYRLLHGDLAAEVFRIVGRDLDRVSIDPRAAERRPSSMAAE